MDTPPQPPATPPAKPRTPEQTDAYAQSLLRMVNMDYAKHEATQPTTQYFTKKRLTYLAVIIAASIILSVVASLALKGKTSSSSQDNQTNQLLKSAQNFNNPSSY